MSHLQKLYKETARIAGASTAALSVFLAVPSFAQTAPEHHLSADQDPSHPAVVAGQWVAPSLLAARDFTLDNMRGCLEDFKAGRFLRGERAHSHHLICAVIYKNDPMRPWITNETTEFESGPFVTEDGKLPKNYQLISATRETMLKHEAGQTTSDVVRIVEETSVVYVMTGGKNWFGENATVLISQGNVIGTHRTSYICENQRLVPCGQAFENIPALSKTDSTVEERLTIAAANAQALLSMRPTQGAFRYKSVSTAP